MATKRKTRRFDEGGMTDEDVKSFAGTPENDSNAGMAEAATEAPAAPAPAKAKPKIVTKEELAKSGLSLRDYMNKQQGLTRRGEKAAPAPKAAPKYETSYDRSRREDREAGRDFDSMVGKLKDRITGAGDRGKALPLKSTKSESGNKFMGSTGLKSGGSVKGWGQARGARKAKMY